MARFEVGQIFFSFGIIEVIKRTEKTVTFAKHRHYKKFNDQIAEVKTVKIRNWSKGEVAFLHNDTIESWEPHTP